MLQDKIDGPFFFNTRSTRSTWPGLTFQHRFHLILEIIPPQYQLQKVAPWPMTRRLWDNTVAMLSSLL